ncbi:phosphotransferase [Priestia aryabhattai]|jgi:aminoglycoside phosphotransferase (APT) family kinase protein|uniref:phosphotransferase n=1 Tax=Priestia aryabhattai TaxID=412384 RepID=UPI002040CE0C|nr:phosphotransferase [Priestia aryabhattai]MCM3770906.1 phosphotransferase [Priestia aryabhattai]
MPHAWDAEQIVSAPLAKTLIETQFPELAPAEISLLGYGFDNTVYQVNGRFVFRFPRRELAAELLKTENQLLPTLASQLPLSIAEPIFFGKPNGVYPWPFTGYHYLQGNPPARLTEEERIQSASVLARFLRTLHHYPYSKAQELGVPFDELNRLDMMKRKPALEKYVKQMKERNLYSKQDILETYVNSIHEIHYQEKNVLVHGDLHIRNMIVDQNNIASGIIDWGDVHIGHPAVDLAIAYSFLPAKGRARFFKEYGEVDEETHRLAKWKAVFTTVVLVAHSYDQGDNQTLEAALESLDLIFQE